MAAPPPQQKPPMLQRLSSGNILSRMLQLEKQSKQQRMSSRRNTTAPADIPASSSVSGLDENSKPNMMSPTSTLSPIMSPQIALNSHPPSAPMRRSPGASPLSINTKTEPLITERPLSASGKKSKQNAQRNDNDGSEICLSPSWSDYRGTKRKKEKKRLGREKRELEKGQKVEQQRAEYLTGKRLSKKPPAAMDTQKMPLAFRRNSGISFLSTTRSSSPDNSRRSSRDEGTSWRFSIGSIGKRRSLSTPSTSTEIPPEFRGNGSVAVSPINLPQVAPDSQGNDSMVINVVKALPTQPPKDGSSYVHKQRMHQQQLSIASYHVELAVKDANERFIRDASRSKTVPKLPPEVPVGVVNEEVPVHPTSVKAVNGEGTVRPTSAKLVNVDGPIHTTSAKPINREEPVRPASTKPVNREEPVHPTSVNGERPVRTTSAKPVNREEPVRPASSTKPVNKESVRPTSTKPVNGEESVRPTSAKTVNGEEPVRPTSAKPVDREEPVRPASTKPVNKEEPVRPASTKPVNREEPVRPTSTKPVSGEEPVRPTSVKPVNGEKPVRPTSAKPVNEEEPVRPASTKPVKREEPVHLTSIKSFNGEGPVRRPTSAKPVKEEEQVRESSAKRPYSTSLLPTTDYPPILPSPPVLPSLDFLPQLKHQPLIKPKRTSPITTPNFPTIPDKISFPASSKFPLPPMTSFPAYSQFPLPSTAFLKPSQDPNIPSSNSAPDLKLLPRSPFRAATDTSLLRPASNPAHRRTMALLSFGKGGIDQGLDPRPVAKLFVICCRCKYWHDLPSNLYELMSSPKKLSRRDSDDGGGRPAAGSINGNAKEATLDTMVQCPWCQHYMTTFCCEGYTTVVYLHERHH